MTLRPRLIGIAILVVAIVAAAWWWFARRSHEERPLVLYGNVDIREVELAFRQPGRLVAMVVDEGASVVAGQEMATLDAQPYRDALAGAEAQVRNAEAELAKLRHGSRRQEVSQAQEAVRQAEASFRNADADAKRQAGLDASGSVSRRVADNARTARDQAAAALGSARQGLSLAREGSRREDVAAAEAKLASAEASAAQAKSALADTRLVSPSDAVVMSRVREPGSMVGVSAAVYTLSLRDPVYVRAYIGEADLGKIGQGHKVRVHSDSSAKVYEGRVGFVSPRAEFTPKSVETTDLRTDLVYRLRIVVSNADDGLRQGMPVTIDVDGATTRG